MIRYLLDTDIVSYAMKRSNDAVVQRLDTTPSNTIAISAIVLAELEFGRANMPGNTRNDETLRALLRNTTVLPFAKSACAAYGKIRTDLKRRGCVIGGNGMLIAAHAISEDLILVTNNTREFERVPGLRIENWAEPH